MPRRKLRTPARCPTCRGLITETPCLLCQSRGVRAKPKRGPKTTRRKRPAGLTDQEWRRDKHDRSLRLQEMHRLLREGYDRRDIESVFGGFVDVV